MTQERTTASQLSSDTAQNGSDAVNAASENSQLAAGANTETEERNKSSEFAELIRGEYKDEYRSSLENALSKRLKTSNKKLAQSEEFRNRLQPVFEILADKYAIEDSTDIDAIISAAQNERMPEEQRIELEFQNQFNGWLAQAEELRQKYPSFDFEYESTNEKTGESFRRLLNSGVDVESAFTVIHKNEIMGGAMQYAYKTAKQEMADARTARSQRPDENGVSSNQSAGFYDDMAKLSTLERKKIKAAVSRGEKVSADNFRRFL